MEEKGKKCVMSWKEKESDKTEEKRNNDIY